MANCADGLIELRNALKRDIREELGGATRYRDMAAKFTHYGHKPPANILHLIASQEMLHSAIIEEIVDDITKKCGEPTEHMLGVRKKEFKVDDTDVTIEFIRPGVHEISLKNPTGSFPEETISKIDKLLQKEVPD